MKYNLNSNVTVQKENNQIILTNQQLNHTTTLIDLSATLFELILEKDDNNIIKDLIKEYNCSHTEAIYTLNSLIYHLLDGNYITSNNKFEFDNQTIYPQFCIIEITDKCNFKCEHCYVHKTNTKMLSFDEIKIFCDELYSINCNRITLTGGEIFTHPQFLDIYNYLYNKGFLIALNTNCSLLNDNILQNLIQKPPFAIEISLYGNNKENFNNFTKTQNFFDITIQNINKLKAENITVRLKNVLTNKNKHCFNEIKNLAHQLNVQFRSDYYVFPNTKQIGTMNKELISPQEALSYLEQQPNATEFYIKKFNNQNNSNYIFKCKYNDDSIFVDSSFNISMCICMQHANIKYQPNKLKNIIGELQNIKNLQYSTNSKCKDCNLKPLCRYCPAKFYQITKSYEIPHQWFCDLGNLIYNKFIKGYKFLKTTYLNNEILDSLYNIIVYNNTSLGYQIKDEDKIIWQQNLIKNLQNANYHLYIIYLNGKIVGFFCIEIFNNIPYVCEVQFSEDNKNTRLILHTINRILNLKELQEYEDIYFGINKNNIKSINTFTHLGAIQVSQTERAYRYKISKNKAFHYLQKFNLKKE